MTERTDRPPTADELEALSSHTPFDGDEDSDTRDDDRDDDEGDDMETAESDRPETTTGRQAAPEGQKWVLLDRTVQFRSDAPGAESRRYGPVGDPLGQTPAQPVLVPDDFPDRFDLSHGKLQAQGGPSSAPAPAPIPELRGKANFAADDLLDALRAEGLVLPERGPNATVNLGDVVDALQGVGQPETPADATPPATGTDEAQLPTPPGSTPAPTPELDRADANAGANAGTTPTQTPAPEPAPAPTVAPTAAPTTEPAPTEPAPTPGQP